MQSVGDQWADVPTSRSSFDAEQIWRVIKENKDLDSLTHEAITTIVRYEEIANENVCLFCLKWGVVSNWRRLCELVCFGKKFSLIIGPCLLEYGAEVMYSYEGVMS